MGVSHVLRSHGEGGNHLTSAVLSTMERSKVWMETKEGLPKLGSCVRCVLGTQRAGPRAMNGS